MSEEIDNVVHVDFINKRKLKSADERPVTEDIPFDPLGEEKWKVFIEWIQETEVALVFDATFTGVKVPEAQASNVELALNFSHKYNLPVFDYDKKGVRAILSFAGANHFCDIPWGSVSTIVNNTTGQFATFGGLLPAI